MTLPAGTNRLTEATGWTVLGLILAGCVLLLVAGCAGSGCYDVAKANFDAIDRAYAQVGRSASDLPASVRAFAWCLPPE